VALHRADDPPPQPAPPLRNGSSRANLRALRQAVEQHRLQALAGQAPKIEAVKLPAIATPANVKAIRIADPDYRLATDTNDLLAELLAAAETSAADARRSRRLALGVAVTMPIFTLVFAHLIR
jgi:hypothetical protein